jgi:ubiquinone/menaquinone biosynthesis C-methylase UbiE
MLNQGIPKVAPLLNAHLISGTAAQLAQPSEVFDVGVICDGLHHFEQPEMAIGEVARVLRPGGTLVVVDPRFDTFLERGFHNSFRWLDKPHRYYRRSEVERLLREAGLEPTTYRNQYLKHYVVGVRAD